MSTVLTQIPGKQRQGRGWCLGEGWSEAGRRAGQRLSDLKSMPRGQGQGRPPWPRWSPHREGSTGYGRDGRLCAPNTAGSGAPRSPRSRMQTSRSSPGMQVSVTIVAVIPVRVVPSGHPCQPPRSGCLPAGGACGRGPTVGPWLPDFTVSSGFFALSFFRLCSAQLLTVTSQ